MKKPIDTLIAAARRPLYATVLFLLVSSSAVSYILLTLFHGRYPGLRDNPSTRFGVFFVTGLAVIALYAVATYFVQRALKMSRRTLGIVAIGTLVLAATMFILYPIALYNGQPYVVGASLIGNDDPNDTGAYMTSGLIMAGVLALAGYIAAKRSRRQPSSKPPVHRSRLVIVGVIVVLIGAVIFNPAFLFAAVMIVSLPFSEFFLPTSASANDIAMLLWVGPAIWIACCAVAIRTCISQPPSTKKIVYRSSLIWAMFALAITIQLVWIVYMWVMVTLWPLKTISPSGK